LRLITRPIKRRRDGAGQLFLLTPVYREGCYVNRQTSWSQKVHCSRIGLVNSNLRLLCFSLALLRSTTRVWRAEPFITAVIMKTQKSACLVENKLGNCVASTVADGGLRCSCVHRFHACVCKRVCKIAKSFYSGTSNNGHCRGISVLSVIGGVR
jgi:hypothetical protein